MVSHFWSVLFLSNFTICTIGEQRLFKEELTTVFVVDVVAVVLFVCFLFF